MKLIIDISKDRYDEIMSMDWKNCRLFFDEEIRAIHDGKVLEQELVLDKIRSEIEQEYKVESEHPYGQRLRRALEIIDKYMAEGSDKE